MDSFATEIVEVAKLYLVERADLMHWQVELLMEIGLTNNAERIVELWNASKLTY